MVCLYSVGRSTAGEVGTYLVNVNVGSLAAAVGEVEHDVLLGSASSLGGDGDGALVAAAGAGSGGSSLSIIQAARGSLET